MGIIDWQSPRLLPAQQQFGNRLFQQGSQWMTEPVWPARTLTPHEEEFSDWVSDLRRSLAPLSDRLTEFDYPGFAQGTFEGARGQIDLDRLTRLPGLVQQRYQTSILPEWQANVLPQINAQYSGPGYWGSARRDAVRESLDALQRQEASDIVDAELQGIMMRNQAERELASLYANLHGGLPDWMLGSTQQAAALQALPVQLKAQVAQMQRNALTPVRDPLYQTAASVLPQLDPYNTAVFYRRRDRDRSGGFPYAAAGQAAGQLALAAALAWSDNRLKHDLKEVQHPVNSLGLKWYKFKWNMNDMEDQGVVAQEVWEKYPELVGMHQGYLTVDYKGLLNKLKIDNNGSMEV